MILSIVDYQNRLIGDLFTSNPYFSFISEGVPAPTPDVRSINFFTGPPLHHYSISDKFKTLINTLLFD